MVATRTGTVLGEARESPGHASRPGPGRGSARTAEQDVLGTRARVSARQPHGVHVPAPRCRAVVRPSVATVPRRREGASHVDGGRPRAAAGRAAAKTSVNGTARPPDSGDDDVGDLAGQAAVPAPHLAVAHDGTAEPFAEVEVDEVVDAAAAPLPRFGAGRPVDVVVDHDRARRPAGPATPPGQVAHEERASGSCTSRPVRRSTGSAALTTASRTAPSAPWPTWRTAAADAPGPAVRLGPASTCRDASTRERPPRRGRRPRRRSRRARC